MGVDEAAAERFLIEARAAAALDHPNVCAIHEIGETEEGRRFLAMAYYEGETLREKLERGPLPVEEAADYAHQIAAALATAHEAGIVHRDIKPGNVLVTPEGTVKVLDFGLAKLADVSLTRAGRTLGTVAYMAPEQLRGAPVDARTDLWALGVVWYEMLAGRRPFPASDANVLSHQILSVDPQPLGELRPDVPEETAVLVGRLLAKDPKSRPGSADAIGRERSAPSRRPTFSMSRRRVLWAAAAVVLAGLLGALVLGGGESPDGDASPARLVLADFEDHTSDSLGPALTEAVRIDLAGSPAVSWAEPAVVRAALERMGRNPDIRLAPSLAREVAVREGLGGVVTGSVRSVGSGYLLTAQVLDPHSGEVLIPVRETAEDRDREVLSAIDRLAKALRRELGESRESLAAAPGLGQVTTSSLEALKQFTRGARLVETAGPEEGLPFVEEAVRLDSTFAMAWQGLAIILAALGEDRAGSVEAITRAYRLRERLTRKEAARIGMMYHSLVTGDMEKAVAAGERLGEILGFRSHNLGVMYADLGQFAEAEKVFMEGIDRRPPESPVSRGDLVRVQVRLGEFAEAEATIEGMTRLPSDAVGPGWLTETLPVARSRLAAGRRSYLAVRERLRELRESTGRFTRRLADTEAVLGRLAAADALYDEVLAADERRGLSATYLRDVLRVARIQTLVRKRPQEALGRIEDALERHPLDSLPALDRPLAELAAFYASAGRTAEARATLARYEEEVRPRHHGLEVMRLVAEAELALAEGDPDAALSALQRLDRIPHNGCRPHCDAPLLGRAWEALGKPDSALAAYERYLVTPPSSLAEIWQPYWDALYLADLHERLGPLYEARGEPEEAAAHYSAFVELWQDADPELQPRVEAAQVRLKEILTERGQDSP